MPSTSPLPQLAPQASGPQPSALAPGWWIGAPADPASESSAHVAPFTVRPLAL